MKVNIKSIFIQLNLYLSEKETGQESRHFISLVELNNVDPIAILAFWKLLVDYRWASQAYQALLAGRDTISAEWDRDGGDELYHLYAQACEERKIYSVLD